MRYYLDLEFIENGPKYPLDIISIGIVDDDGREYYAVSRDFNEKNASDWVKENVLNKLNIPDTERKPNVLIAREIIKFIGDDSKPTFVADFADYDWVVFCQLFGRMIDLPKHFPMFCLDVQQFKYDLGVSNLPELNEKDEHNALNDAKLTKKRWEYLMKIKFVGKRKFNLQEFRKMLEKK
jgi:hypothetical protein